MISSSAQGAGLIAVRRGALGDTVLFLPVLQALRRAHPAEPLCFAGNGDYLELARRFAGAEELRSVEGWAPLKALFSGAGPPGPLPPAWAGARKVLLEWDGAGDWGPVRLFDPRPAPGIGEPITRQILRRTGLLSHAPWPPEPLPRPAARRASRVLLHPGAGSPAKRWPLASFALLGRALARAGLRPLFLLGPVEAERGPWPEALAAEGLEVQALLALEELLALLPEAVLWVGGDSGPTHLAAALGVPALALFGPTDPAVWAPPWPNVRVLGADPLAGLSVERVRAEAEALLG